MPEIHQPLDLYLCSTVRNLIFALLRSFTFSKNKSLIIVITDQQNLSPLNYNLTILPKNIEIVFLKRKEILNSVYSGTYGYIYKMFSIGEYRLPKFLKNKLLNIIFKKIPMLIPYFSSPHSELYLFNDRNRLAKLLRVTWGKYHIIEDGLSNYMQKRSSVFFKMKMIIQNREFRYRLIGDHSDCSSVFLLRPEEADPVILHKSKKIDFIDCHLAHESLKLFFQVNAFEDFDVIIATQPIAIGDLSHSEFDLVIYGKIITYLQNMNLKIAFKCHPRESANRYAKLAEDLVIIDSKIPLEVLLLSSACIPKVISIYSTAGMGFEDFCNRLTLIKNEQKNKQEQIFLDWKHNSNLIDIRLRELIQ